MTGGRARRWSGKEGSISLKRARGRLGNSEMIRGIGVEGEGLLKADVEVTCNRKCCFYRCARGNLHRKNCGSVVVSNGDYTFSRKDTCPRSGDGVDHWCARIRAGDN